MVLSDCLSLNRFADLAVGNLQPNQFDLLHIFKDNPLRRIAYQSAHSVGTIANYKSRLFGFHGEQEANCIVITQFDILRDIRNFARRMKKIKL